MLLSMTGHGEAHCVQDGVAVSVEVRSVNNRFLKIVVRTGEGQNALEPEIENLIRKQVRRGSVQVKVRIDREAGADDFRINTVALESYRRQLDGLVNRLGVAEPVRWEALLALPGVVAEATHEPEDAEAVWPLIERTMAAASANLTRMRAEEGAAMAADLLANSELLGASLAAIEQRVPQVVTTYRDRLTERINRLLQEFGVSIQPADVVREVGLFADRSDISEEIVRLRSHLEQFAATIREEESNGRKLEFVVQEMLREANTIGSKANDAEIARHVVEIKTTIERLREMVQNVE